MATAAEILEQAKNAQPLNVLGEHRLAIQALRDKDYSWREIADFLVERGVDTDHTKIFRFMQRNGLSQKQNVEGFFIPSADQYSTALCIVREVASEEQLKMLEFHYKAHNRTATFTELAKAAGESSYRFANKHYGSLGRILGETVEMNFFKPVGKDRYFYCSSIGTDNPYLNSKADYQLVMHHELAKAIGQLGWF